MSYSFVFDNSPQVLNLFAEWLSWCILWAGIKVYSRYSSREIESTNRYEQEDDSTSLAFFIVTSSVCASITEVNWVLPFLTPALYFVTRGNEVGRYVLPGNFQTEKLDYPLNYGYHLISYMLVAIATSLLFLPSSTTPSNLGLGIVFLLCQTAIFSRLSPSISDAEDYRPARDIFLSLESTCCWVVCFLTIILLVSPQESLPIFTLSISSLFRVFLWIAVVFLCNEGFACTLTLMSTFGLATTYTLIFPSPVQATLSCLCALLVLFQLMASLPRGSQTRRLITLFALIPIAALLFRFGFSEQICLSELIAEAKEWLRAGTTCGASENISNDVIEVVGGVMDEPSRLVAEYGPRKSPESWMRVIMKLPLRAWNRCENPITGSIELR